MSTQEFYIRREGEQEARGPFGFAQMAGMIAQGDVTGDTLYFDGAREDWVALSECEELKSYFPAQAKPGRLRLRVKSEEKSSNEIADAQTEAVSVRDLLAAGNEDGKAGRKKVWQIRMGVLALILVAMGFLGTEYKVFAGGAYGFFESPFLWMGALFFLCSFGVERRGDWDLLRNVAAFGLGVAGLVLLALGEIGALLMFALSMSGLIAASFVRGRAAWGLLAVSLVSAVALAFILSLVRMKKRNDQAGND